MFVFVDFQCKNFYFLFGHMKNHIDLFLFSDNLFIFSHSITLESSSFIRVSTLQLISLKELTVLDNVVSPAYIIKSNLLLHCEKSFIYIINNIGPRIEPCEHQFV